ncbi:MAG: hypothetical protein ACI86P_000831 [Flavobacteriales bacterium]|jgi:hypothetical protein
MNMNKRNRHVQKWLFNSSLFYVFLTLVFCNSFISNSFGQLDLYHSNEIPVKIDGETIDFPWAGGLNNPQFSNIDLNFDGVEDLFIFDRTNNNTLAFIHNGQTSSTDYTITFDYETAFPTIRNWALLSDYNCDGKVDIFTHRSSGIRLYENTGSLNNPSFVLRNDFIQAEADLDGDPINFGIYVSSVDIPAFDDIDGDGDIDILTFAQQGTTVQLYINHSMELFGNCDSLAFELANNCYGQFSESIINEDIFLGNEADCPFNVLNPLRNSETPRETQKSGGAHSGSSICMIDTDQNGYKDLLIGDISSRSLNLVSIGPSSTNLDSATNITEDFPVLTNTVNTEFFATAYYLDVDNDGVKDLLASPSNSNESEDVFNSYYYKNDGANDLLIPNYQQKDFLVDQMIDVGTGSFPNTVDYNSDGLMDLIITNKGYYQLGGDYEAHMLLFLNTGTAIAPEFTLLDDDYLDLSTSGLGRYLYPTFGDLDDDGDQDMLVGNEDGKIYYFENSADAGQTLQFTIPFQSIMDNTDDPVPMDIGLNAAPQLIDISGDGLLDLVIGERNGNINYFKNQGNANNWSFELEDDSLGNMTIDLNQDLIGYGIQQIFSQNDELKMIVGTQEGNLLLYDNISGNLDGTFNLVADHILDANLIERAAPLLADLNNDNFLDLIVGNFSGGLDLWMGEDPDGIAETTLSTVLFDTYPNPTNNLLQISPRARVQGVYFIKIYNTLGELTLELNAPSDRETSISTNKWAPGIYHVTLQYMDRISTKKIVVVKN